MRALVQRVTRAGVTIGGERTAHIGAGYLVLLGVGEGDSASNCRRGRRPSFTGAASPKLARELYEYFVELARRDVARVQTGTFAADMSVDLVNDGPFTVMLDTADL